MKLPPKLKQRYLSRLDELIRRGEEVPVQNTQVLARSNYVTGENRYRTVKNVDWPKFVEWRTACVTILDQVVPRSSAHRKTVDAFSTLNNEPGKLQFGVAFLKAIREDIETDHLNDIASEIEAEVTADYMGQAERLLAEGTSGKYDHVPAAVLAGAVLEKSLKTLCSQLSPPEPTVSDDGGWLRLNALIDALKKRSAITNLLQSNCEPGLPSETMQPMEISRFPFFAWSTKMVMLHNTSSPFSPTDFMRARRPELYSDTEFTEKPVLDRSQFEFHLDTLTQRKEEIRFEHFCRRLAEKELCPNLIPQTGPTGGGDSKVDSETFPVADAIAERWYEGDPKRAARERWAFAFSAKKRWRPKVEDDVRKIAETGRDYALIYFMTNQAVRDRDRAAVEDALRKQWGVEVRKLECLYRKVARGFTASGSQSVEAYQCPLGAHRTCLDGLDGRS